MVQSSGLGLGSTEPALTLIVIIHRGSETPIGLMAHTDATTELARCRHAAGTLRLRRPYGLARLSGRLSVQDGRAISGSAPAMPSPRPSPVFGRGRAGTKAGEHAFSRGKAMEKGKTREREGEGAAIRHRRCPL